MLVIQQVGDDRVTAHERRLLCLPTDPLSERRGHDVPLTVGDQIVRTHRTGLPGGDRLGDARVVNEVLLGERKRGCDLRTSSMYAPSLSNGSIPWSISLDIA